MKRKARGDQKRLPNEDQHHVAKGYTKQWRDPGTPQGAFLWMIERDGPTPEKPAKHGAPKSIFTEPDMYTITRDGEPGVRDLSIEHALGRIENDFCTVRSNFIQARKPLSVRQRVIVCAFAAAAYCRTPGYREHMRGQFQPILDKARRLEERMKAAPEGTKQKWRAPPLSSVGSDSRRSMTVEDVQAIVSTPLQTTLPSLVTAMTPELAKMTFTILCTETTPGFITSDEPCVWYDPEAHMRAPFFRRIGLMYNSLQITLPISPTRMLMLTRQKWPEYFDIDVGDAGQRLLDEVNRLTCRHARETIIVSRNEYRPHWALWGDPPKAAEPDRNGENA